MACFGWDYSREQARECAARKLPQPYPFAAGTLELVAMPLAHFFASDATGRAEVPVYLCAAHQTWQSFTHPTSQVLPHKTRSLNITSSKTFHANPPARDLS